jgi:hypothetical protein
MLFSVVAVTISLSASAEGGMFGFVKKLGTFLDSMAVSGIDRRYIDAPQKPWQILLKGNINQSDLKLSSTIHHAEERFDFMKGDMVWEPHVKTKPASYAGLWAGYRGYGLGYSWNIGGDKGHILTVGATGGSYGANLRIHWFDNDEPNVYYTGNALLDITDEGNRIYYPINYSDNVELGSPIKTRALFFDGFYLFNGRKCSYAAAYDQSVIQKRSAGSLMAGAMYFHSTTHYDTDNNADFILFMDDVGRFKSWQASAGVGYIYNWVPAKGLLISGMAIPMATFYSHHKLWRYDSNLKEVVKSGGLDDLYDVDEADYRIWESKQNGVESMNSSLKWNIDARLSITYEWDNRLFFNAYGQFSNFQFKTDEFNGRLNDWYINTSIGIRL